MQRKSQFGRSMVEMLGVLAIIGVLSAGALAGYHKAIFKHKLNTQSQQLNSVFGAITRYRDKICQDQTNRNYTADFVVLNEIPQPMLRKNDTNYFYDSFGSTMYIHRAMFTGGKGTIRFYYHQTNLNKGFNEYVESCRSFVSTARAYADDLYILESYSGDDIPEEEEQDIRQDIYYGTGTHQIKQIKQMDLVQIDEVCRMHAGTKGQTARMILDWKC